MNGQQTFKDSILNIFLLLVPVYIITEFIIKLLLLLLLLLLLCIIIIIKLLFL